MQDRQERTASYNDPDTQFELALTREFHEQQRSLRAEMQRPAPDMSRVRGLRDALNATRRKISALHGEPPPHTD